LRIANYPDYQLHISLQKTWIQETICANHNQPKPAFCGPQSPTAAPTSCADMAVVVTVDSDNYPDEISWKITGETTISSPGYQYADSNYVNEYCLDATKCYTFTIRDGYGDGILSPGGYSVEVDGEAVDGLGDVFESEGKFEDHKHLNSIDDGRHNIIAFKYLTNCVLYLL
jgi:hypothetical protein